MNSKDKKREYIKNIITVMLGLLIAYEFYILLYDSYLASQALTTRMSTKVIYDLGHGVNPYGKEWLKDPNALPPTYYESGFFHLFPAVLLVKLGVSVYYAQAIANIYHVALAMFAGFLCVKAYTKNRNYGLLAAAITYFVVFCNDYASTRPDTLCVALIYFVMFLIYKDYEIQISGADNKFAYIYEWLIAFLCVLLVFLKIHYGSITAAVVVYYFVKMFRGKGSDTGDHCPAKKKIPRWIYLGLKAAVITIGMIAFVQILFPTFFSTFIVRVIEMFKTNVGGKDYAYLMSKWVTIFCMYWPLIIATLLGIGINFKNVIKNKIELFIAVNTIINIVALCFMGMWQGNGLAYFNVMLIPSLVVSAFYYVSKLNSVEGGSIKGLGNWKMIISVIFCVAGLCMAIIYSGNIKPRLWKPVPYDYANQITREYFDSFGDKELLLAPGYAWYSLSTGRYQWDYGDQIYMPNDIGTSPRWNFLFPYTNEYRGRMQDYCRSMIEKIENKEYGLIILDDNNVLGLFLGLEDEFEQAIEENYEVDDRGYYLPKE